MINRNNTKHFLLLPQWILIYSAIILKNVPYIVNYSVMSNYPNTFFFTNISLNHDHGNTKYDLTLHSGYSEFSDTICFASIKDGSEKI